MGTSSSPAPIIGHPDVKRMLLGMKSTVEACRAMALYAAHQLDLGAAHPDEAVRAAARARGDLLIPIVKGFCTESGIEIASVGIQVHGGMGYVEETGAAQTFRDVRITSIYEGTTGIQSNDLIGRKFGRDRGAALLAFHRRDAEVARRARARCTPSALQARGAAHDAVARLRKSTDALLAALATAPDRAMAVSVPFLQALWPHHRRLADGARRGHRRATSSPPAPAIVNSSRRNSRPRISMPRRCCRRCWRSNTSCRRAAKRWWEPTPR